MADAPAPDSASTGEPTSAAAEPATATDLAGADASTSASPSAVSTAEPSTSASPAAVAAADASTSASPSAVSAPHAEPPADTPALRAIAAAGISHRVVRSEAARTAEEAAQLQGIDLAALIRTIVVRRGEDDYLFVLVPAGRRFDWPKLRAHLGVSRMSLPDAEEARAVTGYERYTITPFGATRAWPVIADASLAGRDVVSIGGGARGVNLHLSAADLFRAVNADLADVSQSEAATD